MATRQIIIWESPVDGWALKIEGLNLHIARSVRLASGILSSTLVWQCRAIGPRRRTITWVPKYGINWTYTVPDPGSSTPVQVDGPWQMFDQSEAFDIFPNGTWRVSGFTGRAGWLKIGRNGFYPASGRQMHILIGVWDVESKAFTPIYVDPSPLAFGASAEYQPTDNVYLWYEAASTPLTRISEPGLPRAEVDLSHPNPISGQHYAAATYLVQEQRWECSVEAPPPATSTGLLGGRQPGSSSRVGRPQGQYCGA